MDNDINKLSPRDRRDDMPRPPMVVRLAADLRPSADGSAVRTSLVAGGGYSLGQLRLGQTDGRISVWFNALPLQRGIRKQCFLLLGYRKLAL